MKSITVFESKIPPVRTTSFLKRPEYYTPIWTYKKQSKVGMVLVVGIVATIAALAAYKHFGV